MAATLKVSDEAKEALDRLQATLTLSLGRKPTLQEVVDQVLALAWEQRAEVLSKLAGWRPATPEEATAMRARIRQLNGQARLEPPEPAMSEEDRLIYGGPEEP